MESAKSPLGLLKYIKITSMFILQKIKSIQHHKVCQTKQLHSDKNQSEKLPPTFVIRRNLTNCFDHKVTLRKTF